MKNKQSASLIWTRVFKAGQTCVLLFGKKKKKCSLVKYLRTSFWESQAHEIKVLGSPAVKKSDLFHWVCLIIADHENCWVTLHLGLQWAGSSSLESFLHAAQFGHSVGTLPHVPRILVRPKWISGCIAVQMDVVFSSLNFGGKPIAHQSTRLGTVGRGHPGYRVWCTQEENEVERGYRVLCPKLRTKLGWSSKETKMQTFCFSVRTTHIPAPSTPNRVKDITSGVL